MEILSFKTIVRNAISELISCEPFYDVAKRNWQKNEGAEEELYPYLTEMIHKESLKCGISDKIIGIGYGKIHRRREKIDCIVYLCVDSEKIAFAVELKGPSKEKAWVEQGLKEDIDKLKQLKHDEVIQYGAAVGICLLDIDTKENIYQHYELERTLQINSCQISVKVKIIDTETNE